jgi:hypothetical protein
VKKLFKVCIRHEFIVLAATEEEANNVAKEEAFPEWPNAFFSAREVTADTSLKVSQLQGIPYGADGNQTAFKLIQSNP